jgi:heat shock protein HtpX
LYRAIAKNKRNTVFIILFFLAIIGGLGWLAAWVYQNLTIVIVTIVIATAYALFQYFTADRQAIAMSGAIQLRSTSDHPRLWRTVENLSIATGSPMPKVYIISDPAPNAFATGRDPEHAVVAATTGLLEIMDDAEL